MIQPAQRQGRRIRLCGAVLATLLISAATASAADSWTALINADNSYLVSFLRNDRPVFQVALNGWGPNSIWVKMESRKKPENDRLTLDNPFIVNKDKGEVINFQFDVWQPNARQVVFQYDMDADRDVPLTQLVASLYFEPRAAKGTIKTTHAETGFWQKADIPFPVHGAPPSKKSELMFNQGGTVTLQIDPPCAITFDNQMRVVLAPEVFKKGKRRVTLTLTFPNDIVLYTKMADIDKASRPLAGPDWFPFRPSNKVVPGVIDMDRWLDRPAGKHGGVRMVDDRFLFEDGTPIKFWGVNLSFLDVAPDKETAEFTAARYAKYGVNAVRLHKFTRPDPQKGIGDPNDTTHMDPKALDRFDYFTAKLKERGIYYGWSHTWGFRVVPSQRKRLLAYDEIAKNLGGSTYTFIYLAEDVQDLLIEMAVNLLKHKNPYTGRTYAEEPALCFVEMQNEDGIFFYGTEAAFNACPTYKKLFLSHFAAWLKERYGSQEALEAVWGDGLNKGETLADENIMPQLNPWYFGEDSLPNKKGGVRRKLLDCAEYLHGLQERFYTRFAQTIRDTGYQGPLIGSTWQAPPMLPHYYNLQTDYKVGFIDRHNYFDGGGAGILTSMLTKPGSGYFRSGLQQVRHRPFALSEWVHEYPNVYSAEGPPIMAVYGMGLQGWDGSYEHQSQSTRQLFSDIVGELPKHTFDTDLPASLGQYPALARMIARGDVKEGDIISVRRISPGDLTEAKFAFSDKVEEFGDVTTTGGSVPPEALAAGRVVVEFTDESQESLLPDMSRYRQGTAIKSTTGQLIWDTAGQGFFTVNTAGTKAVVGFTGGKEQTLGDVKIKLNSPFASLFLTALGPHDDLTTGSRALISVVARQSNSGFVFFPPDSRVIQNGGPPILLEPVKATITFAGRSILAVHVLDHDGRRTGRTLPVTDGQFMLDGTTDKAIYYEVVFAAAPMTFGSWMGVIAALFIIGIVLVDAFEVMILPRRVRHGLRLARIYYRAAWRLCLMAARLLPAGRWRNAPLSVFGPLSLLGLLVLWAAGLIVGFGLLHWSLGTNIWGSDGSFFSCLYFSGTTFFTLGYGDLTPLESGGRVLSVIEAGLGFGFLALTISYLPVLYQTFSRREITISLLDARAGSPPTAGELLRRLAAGQNMAGVGPLLMEWERWSAELLESHLSYPVLSYYRSQHDNQSWVGALTTILDTSALLIAAVDGPDNYQARLTFAMARHAAVDLALVFSTHPQPPKTDRLSEADRERLWVTLREAGVTMRDEAAAAEALRELRGLYEPFVNALARDFRLTLPPLLPEKPPVDNWQTSAWMARSPGLGGLPAGGHKDHFD